MTSQAYQKGETARGVQRRDDRAYARITKAAERSAAATIGNNRRPYHWKRHNCQRRYVLKYLHLGLNSRQQLALNGECRLLLRNPPPIGSQTIGRSEHHLARISEHHLARISEHHLARFSEPRLRPLPVGCIYGIQVGYILPIPHRGTGESPSPQTSTPVL
jgi:hypothetical protein